ncbi:MAG TPA: Hsp20/alpha crystallin family protein [Acidobacteriota bacterium]|nr:Hsp20/alpha crystallin family protein [Acidobacteriota bacterium]
MDHLFGDFWGALPWSAGSLRFPRDTWVPRMDAFEKDGMLHVKTDLPGLEKDDIEVAIQNGDLVIRGERKAEEKVEKEDYYCLERSSGNFFRRLALPFEVDVKDIDAKFKDGTLEVMIPVPEMKEPEAQKIAIH